MKKKKPSSRRRCFSCARPGRYAVAFLFRRTFDSTPVPGLTAMTVCEEHKPELKASELLGPDAIQAVTVAYKASGNLVPDFELTELAFEEIA